MNKNIIVIYHGECSDGFSAAWIAWKKFGDKAEYVPAYHQEQSPEGLAGKEIYILDFSFPKEVMAKIVKENKKVTVIDHHKSAEETVKMAHEYLYEMNHSGAALAWRFFYPDLTVPWLIRYIEDMDIWKLELPDIFAMTLVLNSLNKDFETWNKLAKDLDDEPVRGQYIKQGNIMLKYEKKLLDEIMDSNKEIVKFEGHEIYAINAPHTFASQIGNALCREKPPIAIVWQRSDGRIEVSLRSEGDVDVSGIAKKYGGGGHKNAAGFKFNAQWNFPWQVQKQNNDEK